MTINLKNIISERDADMNKYMPYAIKEAALAMKSGEIPVGAVIVKDGKIIASDHNRVEQNGCTLCHAEINVIDKASKICGKFLTDCEMYVTLEPCPMCTGAIINSRIKRLYIGASEPKSGSCGTKIDIINSFGHSIEVYHGIMESECKNLMKTFFEKLRKN